MKLTDKNVWLPFMVAGLILLAALAGGLAMWPATQERFALIVAAGLLLPLAAAVMLRRALGRQQAALQQALRAAAASEQARQDWLALLDESPAIMLRVSQAGTLVYQNRAAQEALALQPGEAVPPEWAAAVTRALAQAQPMATTLPAGGRTLACTLTPIAVEGTVLVQGVAVTAGGEAERDTLMAQLTRLMTIIETTSDLVAVASLQETIQYVNPAGMALLGRVGEDFRRLTIPDLVPPPVSAQMSDQIMPLVHRHGVWAGESTLQHVDGTVVPVSQVIMLLRDQQGEPNAIGMVSRDITERKQVERSLEQAMEGSQKSQRLAEEAQAAAEAANQAKNVFLANMSHELRTPLTAIIGFSQVLTKEIDRLGKPVMVRDLQRIEQAGQHLLAIINDILDLSRLETGHMRLDLETFAVTDVVEPVVTALQPLADKNRNQLTVAVEDRGTMVADRDKVQRILVSLLTNALKFTHRGQVSLRVSRQLVQRERGQVGEWIIFEVRDTGIGMSSSQMGDVFQPFTQADSSAARRYGGTGLGLAISRHFSHLMGGEIYVESETDAGSVFQVYLPARVAPPVDAGGETASAPADPGPAAPAPANASIVLVIDNDPVSRDLIQRQLNNVGLHSFSATVGDEGLSLAEELGPGLIILSVPLPHLDAWQLLPLIQHHPQLEQTPVIVVAMVEEQYRGLVLNAAAYLLKPVDEGRLAALLQHQFGRPPDGGADRRALLIEDDPQVRQQLAGALAQHRWRVTAAENGREALDSMVDTVPDLILLDMFTPVMDGFAFIEELRRQPDWSQIPIILLLSTELTPVEQRLLAEQVDRMATRRRYDTGSLLRQISDLAIFGLRQRYHNGPD